MAMLNRIQKMSTLNVNADEALIQQYRDEFDETQCVFIPGLLGRPALANLQRKLEQTKFETKFEMGEANKFGKVLFAPQTDTVIFGFNLLLNNPALFQLLDAVTGCGCIGNFVGRIHRSDEGEGHEIKWHNDASDTRLLAVTIGLGNERYEGSKLQIRKKGAGELLREFGQIEAGDAVFFKIDPELEHRLTILDKGRRTVGVGWFRREPDFDSFAKSYLKPF